MPNLLNKKDSDEDLTDDRPSDCWNSGWKSVRSARGAALLSNSKTALSAPWDGWLWKEKLLFWKELACLPACLFFIKFLKFLIWSFDRFVSKVEGI